MWHDNPMVVVEDNDSWILTLHMRDLRKNVNVYRGKVMV